MFNILFGAFLILWMADYITTVIALNKGLSEANPVIKLILRVGKKQGLLYLGIFKAVLAVIVYFLAWPFVAFGFLLMCYVCYNNLRHICGR